MFEMFAMFNNIVDWIWVAAMLFLLNASGFWGTGG